MALLYVRCEGLLLGGKKEIKYLLDFWFEQLGREKPQDGGEGLSAYTLLKDRKRNPFKR